MKHKQWVLHRFTSFLELIRDNSRKILFSIVFLIQITRVWLLWTSGWHTRNHHKYVVTKDCMSNQLHDCQIDLVNWISMKNYIKTVMNPAKNPVKNPVKFGIWCIFWYFTYNMYYEITSWECSIHMHNFTSYYPAYYVNFFEVLKIILCNITIARKLFESVTENGKYNRFRRLKIISHHRWFSIRDIRTAR